MRGADLLIQSIVKSGTDTIFTVSGNQIMPIFDASIDSNLNIIHCRHEASAVFMADGYFQTSGKVGIALVTAAPGFTNALGPLYSIKAAQSAIVLLSGDSPLSQEGLMPFQELDQTSVSDGLVKKSWKIKNAHSLGNDIAKAISFAKSGRPGPVHIALPFDLLNEKISNVKLPELKNFKPKLKFLNMKEKNELSQLFKSSKKPLVITGPSLSYSRQSILYKKIKNNFPIPIIPMLSPRGVNDPSLGKIKVLLEESDFLLLLDKDIDFTLGFGNSLFSQKVVMITPLEKTALQSKKILNNRLINTFIIDPLSVLTSLSKISFNLNIDPWVSKVNNLLSERKKINGSLSGKITPLELCETVIQETKDLKDLLYVIDGGEFGQWAQSITPKDKMFLNGLSGAIGGATSQAIGSAIANPGEIVIAFMGDGTAGFHPAEWETARRFNLPIIYIIGNDRRWGAEVEIQIREYGDNRAKHCFLDNTTRYDKIAKGFGCDGFFINNIDELKRILKKVIVKKNTVVLDIEIEGHPAPFLN